MRRENEHEEGIEQHKGKRYPTILIANELL
jgi:hypothetical protein